MADNFNAEPIIDPTKNVLYVVEKDSKRQDELREKESIHLREIMELRQVYTEKMMEKDSARIDALRQVDTQAIAFATEQQRQQAALLAEQTRQTFDVIRGQIVDLQKNQQHTAGTTGGRKDLWILLVGGILFLISVASFVLDLITHG